MQTFSVDITDRLKSFKPIILNYVTHNINPINSQIIELRDLYHNMGLPPIGTCGGCIDQVIHTLNAIIKENNI